MLSSSSVHRTRMPVGTLVIVFALIGWGLQYKTSLYRHFFHASSNPPAKLLSDAERPSIEQSTLQSSSAKVTGRKASHWALDAARDCSRGADKNRFAFVPRMIASAPRRTPVRFFLRAPPLAS